MKIKLNKNDLIQFEEEVKQNCDILGEDCQSAIHIKPIKEGQELTVYYTIGYDDLIQ